MKSGWFVAAPTALVAALLVPARSQAQDAYAVASMCARMNSPEPAIRAMLNERIRENPAITLTGTGGFIMMGTRGGGYNSRGMGLGGSGQLEVELGALTPFWARANVRLLGAGRFGMMGEAAVGFTLRDYGVAFVPAGSAVYVSRYSVSYSSWGNHCTLRRFDFHGFLGIRTGVIFPNGDPMATGGRISEGWLAPQLGLTFRNRRVNFTNDTTIAGMFDVTHLSWGLYARSYVAFGWFLVGFEGGFFLSALPSSTPYFSATNTGASRWDGWWLTADLGFNFEI